MLTSIPRRFPCTTCTSPGVMVNTRSPGRTALLHGTVTRIHNCCMLGTTNVLSAKASIELHKTKDFLAALRSIKRSGCNSSARVPAKAMVRSTIHPAVPLVGWQLSDTADDRRSSSPPAIPERRTSASIARASETSSDRFSSGRTTRTAHNPATKTPTPRLLTKRRDSPGLTTTSMAIAVAKPITSTVPASAAPRMAASRRRLAALRRNRSAKT